MAIFEIYSSENRETVEFVSDKKPLLALILPALWLFWNNLWFAFAIYMLITILFAGLSSTDWSIVVALISFVPGVFVFLEGNNWKAAKFERIGLQFAGLVEADNYEAAELRWFSNQPIAPLAAQDVLMSSSKLKSPLKINSENDMPEFGVFASDQ